MSPFDSLTKPGVGAVSSQFYETQVQEKCDERTGEYA